MRHSTNLYLIFFIFLMFAQPLQAFTRNNNTCDIQQGEPLHNAYGPWDYINPAHKERLPIVIQNHFNSGVERLIKGQTGTIEHDLDYTLRAIPNFHRALNAVSKYQRMNNIQYAARDNFWTAECYFKRAIYFQPADPTARLLFGIHLHMLKKYEEALLQYHQALQIQSDNPEAHYNLGLLYLDMDKLKKAKEHAKKAYDMGFPLEGLKNRISRAESKPKPEAK